MPQNPRSLSYWTTYASISLRPAASLRKKKTIVLYAVTTLDNLGLLKQELELAEWLEQRSEKYSDTSSRAAVDLAKIVQSVFSRLSWLEQKLDLSSRTLDGQPFDLRSLQGKVTLVEFWGTNCPPCIADLPALKRIYRENRDQGFEIVAICLHAAPARIEQFCKEHELPGCNCATIRELRMNATIDLCSATVFRPCRQLFWSIRMVESSPSACAHCWRMIANLEKWLHQLIRK